MSDRLSNALDRLEEAMDAGDRQRQMEGKPLLWGGTDHSQRKRFENEAKTRFPGISLKKRADGEYHFDATSNIFLGWQAATLAERERCAKIAESFGDHDCAAAIRRGEEDGR